MNWLIELFGLLHDRLPAPSGRSHFMTARDGQIMLLMAREGDRTTAIRLNGPDFEKDPSAVVLDVDCLLQESDHGA